METEKLTLPGLVFLGIMLILILGFKVNVELSVVLGFIGFGVAYYLTELKK
tara:strand:+ start:45 stop:197 length:153 start_codon:yes stop_codon:yes gene_type:complete